MIPTVSAQIEEAEAQCRVMVDQLLSCQDRDMDVTAKLNMGIAIGYLRFAQDTLFAAGIAQRAHEKLPWSAADDEMLKANRLPPRRTWIEAHERARVLGL